MVRKSKAEPVGITEFTIQYYQSYLPSSYHPDPENRKAFLFASTGYSAMSRNIQLSGDALRSDYKAFRDRKLPKLLKRSDIPEEDKKHLQFLKETKKWFPYIVRHSSLSRLAPNISEYRLREHAGWSKRSDMVEIYSHTLTGDSAEDILMLYGVNLKGGKKKRNERLQQEMVGPHCPFCHMVNTPDSQFCSSCHKPLTSVSYNKIMQEAERTKGELEQMRQEQRKIMNNLKLIMPMLQNVTTKLRIENIEMRQALQEAGEEL